LSDGSNPRQFIVSHERLSSDDTGNGPTILLLHGFQSSSYDFRPAIAPLWASLSGG
jgi:pimeloyl-ACP methyl ester carboxylesterase